MTQSPPLMLVVGSATPSFSFVAPGESPGKSQMTDYQIVVRNSAGSIAWDSGKVAAPGGHVAGVACAVGDTEGGIVAEGEETAGARK